MSWDLEDYKSYITIKAEYDRITSVRKKMTEDMRSLLDGAEREKRGLSTAEDSLYNTLDARCDALTDKLEQLKPRLSDAEAKENRSPIKPDPVVPGAGGYEKRSNTSKGKTNMKKNIFNDDEYRFNERGTSDRDAFNKYLRYGTAALEAAQFRNLQMDSATGGGYLVAPLNLVNNIIVALNNEVFIREMATIFESPNAESLGVPDISDNDFGDPTWTAEILTGAEDDSLAFTRREMRPHPLARRILVSNKLLRASQLNPEALVAQRMVYKIGTVLERSYLLGSGNSQPLGVFTPSDVGISADRDISTGNTTTSVTGDGLINAAGMLKAQYRKYASWIFHRDLETRIRKLKDGIINLLPSINLVNSREAVAA